MQKLIFNMIKYYKQIIPLLVFLLTIGYVILGDVSLYIFGEANSIWYKYIFIAIIVLAYLFFILITRQLDVFFARKFGFTDVHRYWAHGSTSQITEHNRAIISHLIKNSKELRVVSVTGDWDLIRPFSESEFSDIFGRNNISLKIILCNPSSDFLNDHSKNEDHQEVNRLISKILNNTTKFKSVNADVRWTSHQPIFHYIATENEIHFGYYPKGERGHSSHRYIVNSKDPLFRSLEIWFNSLWADSTKARIDSNKSEIISKNKVIFLDRDDTLVSDIGYKVAKSKTEINILPGVIDGLKLLRNSGYKLIIVSNQQAVGLGVVSQNDFILQNKLIKEVFKDSGVMFDKMYFCLHTETESCDCRKPKPGLFMQAQQEFNIDSSKSHFIGDSTSDLNVGNYIKELSIHIVEEKNSFTDIVRLILNNR